MAIADQCDAAEGCGDLSDLGGLHMKPVLAFECKDHVEWFEGNFEAYEEDKRRRLGDAADRPTRLAYKKLTR